MEKEPTRKRGLDIKRNVARGIGEHLIRSQIMLSGGLAGIIAGVERLHDGNYEKAAAGIAGGYLLQTIEFTRSYFDGRNHKR